MAGPEVPIYQSDMRVPEGPRPGLTVQNPPVPDMSGIGKAVNEFAVTLKKAQDETDDARLKTETLPLMQQYEQSATQSPDYRGAPVDFDKDATKLIRDKSGDILDPERRAKFALWATEKYVASRGRVQKSAFDKEKDYNAGAYQDRATAYQQRVNAAGSPIERQSVIDDWNADIQGQTDAGWADHAIAAQRRAKMVDMVGDAVLARTRDDLDGLKNKLGAATDAGAVQGVTASIIRDGESVLVNSGLPPIQADAAIRAWRRQAAEAGLSRLGQIDPEAARVAGGRSGAGPALADKIVGVESGGDARAANPNSSALGAGQFTEATWLNMMSTYHPELVTGRTRDDVLALRTDAKLSRELTGRYAEQNATVLRARGLPINDGNLYLAHFLGPGGASNVLSVDPSTPVDKVLTPGQIAANRSVLEGKTAGEVAAWAQRKMGSASSEPAGGGDPLFAAIPFDRRVQILDNAESSAARSAQSVAQQAEKLRKAQSDEVVKEAYSRADKGELTGAYVEAIRAALTPTEYKTLLNLLGPDAASNDTEAMIDLTRRIDSSDPADFLKTASDYLRRGKVTTSTFVQLSEKNRAARRDDAPASGYRSGREIVKSVLDPGLLVSGSARAPLAQAQSNALADFDNWSQANPQATRADALAAAQDVVKRYQTVDFAGVKLTIGQSRYFGGKGRDGVTLEDVTAAEDALMKDDTAGRVTPAQMVIELRRLTNWREILEREQKAKEAPRGGAGK